MSADPATDSATATSTTSAPAAPPTLWELFTAFGTIALSGFGGVLPWTRRMMVDEKRWMTAEEFNAAFALSQFLPGPNIVNFSVVFGSRMRGVPGAITATLALLAPPLVIVVIIAALYAHYGEIESLRRALAGIACAAAGLIMATVVKMGLPLLRQPLAPAPVILVAAFVAVGLLRWPLPYVVLVLAPLSIAIAWWRLR
jgi:chromate transporter